MTRQKKEILDKIEEMEAGIDADIELGCGFSPPNAYEDTYQEIEKLYDELARLRHYENAEEMFSDTRGLVPGRDYFVFDGDASSCQNGDSSMSM